MPCPTAYTSIIYNWYLNNVLVAAGTSNTFSANIAGDYYVVVTGAPCGSKRSNTIKVCGPPTVTITGPCAICAGQTALLHTVVDGCCLQPCSYQWSTTETTQDIVVNTPGTYSVTVTTGNCSASASHTIIQCPSTTFTCGNAFNDPRDVGGHIYNTVQIGTQCWMKENLVVGSQIPANTEQTNNNNIEKYCYADNSSNCGIYGGLYQWNEMMNYSPSGSGVQGICPTGWHVPSDAEWCLMENYLDPTVSCSTPVTGWRGTDAGGRLKSTGTIQSVTGLWNYPNLGATNSSGFTAFPGGHRNDAAGTFGKDNYAYFWTSTESTPAKAWEHGLGYLFQKVSRYDYDKSGAISFGLSVRCVKN